MKFLRKWTDFNKISHQAYYVRTAYKCMDFVNILVTNHLAWRN